MITTKKSLIFIYAIAWIFWFTTTIYLPTNPKKLKHSSANLDKYKDHFKRKDVDSVKKLGNNETKTLASESLPPTKPPLALVLPEGHGDKEWKNKTLRKADDAGRHLDHSLYQKMYKRYHLKTGEVPKVKEDNIDRPIKMDTYGESVLKRGCTVTVVIMDPRIPLVEIGSPGFFALESIGAFLPDACVVIQTSKCKFKKSGLHTNVADGDAAVYDRIYELSPPLFAGMIERGQVRVTFLNHAKYYMKSCDNFYNPSAALMNVHYWGDDEFVPGVDSDTVLVMQDDSVLCHSFDLERYRKFAYVGAIWQRSHPFMPQTGDMCNILSKEWRKYHSGYQMRGKVPTFPTVCDGKGGSPMGNGGFSLRSRKAMIEVIKKCPHGRWSGLDQKSINASLCMPGFSEMNEDVYFGTLLRGTGAVLPSAFEASLFSVEQTWPEQGIEMYGGPSVEDRHRIASEVSGIYQGASISVNRKSNGFRKSSKFEKVTVPIGFHKPWWYFDNDVLLSKDIDEQCPFLKYVFHPKQNWARGTVQN